MSKKDKKVQRTCHFSEEIDKIIRERTALTLRGYSAEIEWMIRHQLETEAKNIKDALVMAGRGKSPQDSQQS